MLKNKDCTYGSETREQLGKLEIAHGRELTEIWKELKEIHKALNNRLPIWATILISILTAAVGYLAKGSS